MKRFEFARGTSNKFWQIEVSGLSIVTRWGRIGAAGQSKTKRFKSAPLAKTEHDRLVAEKIRKGYRAVHAKALAKRLAGATEREKASRRKQFHREWDRGKTLSRRGYARAALKSYEKAVAAFDANDFTRQDASDEQCDLWSDIAAAHSKSGNPLLALKAIDRSLKLRRGYNPTPLYNKGVILGELGRYRMAIGYYDRAIKMVRSLYAYPPEQVGAYWCAKAEALEALGDTQGAIQNYEYALPIGKGRGSQGRGLTAEAKNRLLALGVRITRESVRRWPRREGRRR